MATVNDTLLQQIHHQEEYTKEIEDLLKFGFEMYPTCTDITINGKELLEMLTEFSGKNKHRVALSLTLKDAYTQQTFTYGFGEDLKLVGIDKLPISRNVRYSIQMIGADLINPWNRQHFMFGILTITFVQENKFKNKKHRNRVIAPRQLSTPGTLTVAPFDGTNFTNENKRLNSFVNWQYEEVVSSLALVRNGFFLNNERKQIICVGCDYQIEPHRVQEINVLLSHKRNSPTCSYVSRQMTSPRTESNTVRRSENDCETDEETDNQNSLQTNLNPFFKKPLYTNGQATDRVHSSSVDYRNSGYKPQQAYNSNQRDSASNHVEGDKRLSELHKRDDTFRYWDHTNFPVTSQLSAAGFYYTGEGDAVRCFSCDIGLADWKPSDDPWIEHARHSPSCTFLKENKTQDFIDDIQHAWSQIYKPRHPKYTELSERIKSFENSEWPYDYVRQTPSEIAEAGFFYIGLRDTVRCHYCDGGLRDWEPEDVPWIEHGRWFPYCKFVIRKKGVEFIQECSTGNGSRPAISEPPIPKRLPNSYTNENFKSSEERWRKIGLENPMKTAAAISVKEMGYPTTTVSSAINTYIARTGKRDFDASALMKIILDWEDQEPWTLEVKNFLHTIDKKSDIENENEEFEFTPEALMKENEILKDKMTCMECRRRERTHIFVPCGHRMMCEDCAKKQSRCCLCDKEIQSSVKTYLV